jgi:ATP-dependent RNA helicase DeaD
MFASDLPTALAEALSGRGYAEPTPVQAAVVEETNRGRDLLVSARTGSGKTVAYGLALAPELFDGRTSLPAPGVPLALVIAPTRELALQVQRELEWLYAGAGGRVVACVGGMDPRREHRMLAAGCHIVVGTPGRLRDHIERGQLLTAGLRAVVLDEADEMLDLGFREELEEILDTTPTERRTLLFSATLPKPIISLATRYQKDALRLEIGAGERSHADIAYQAVRTAPSDLTGAVVNLLRYHDAGAALVFCNLRATVARLHADLVERGFAVVALSGELSQGERTKALQSLRDGRAKVCVATDVAARGIDIPDLELVIHADLPANIETLQHRSGRTGRAGRKGLCAVVVPYPRQRKAELLFRNARIEPEWLLAPSSDLIRERDRARLSAELTANAPEEGDEDLIAARALLEEHSAETLAAALVRLNRARLPAPEDLHDGPASAAPVPGLSALSPFNAAPRPGFEDTAWFRLDLGRSRNADPKWILPLICRRGHITKTDIGAIRIFDRETRFEIVRTVEARFLEAIAREPDEEPRIEPIDADLAPPPERDKKPFKAKKRSNAEGGDKPAWDKPKSSYDPAAGERAGAAKPAWERKPKRDHDRPQVATAASSEAPTAPAWERKPRRDHAEPRAEARASSEAATTPAWDRKTEPAAEGKRGYPRPRPDAGAKPAWGEAPRPAYDKAKPKSKSNAGPKAGWMDKPAYDPAADKPPFKKTFKPADGARLEGGEAGEPRGKPHAPWAGKAQGAKSLGAKPYAPKTHAGADGKAKPFKPYAGAKKAKKRD